MTQGALEAPAARPRRLIEDRAVRRRLAVAATLLALALGLVGLGRLAPDLVELTAGGPVRHAVEAELQRTHAPRDVAAFYQARGDRPVWVEMSGPWPFWTRARLRPEAAQMAAIAAEPMPGVQTGPEAKALEAAIAAAGRGGPADLARAEVALSRALADHVLRPPPKGAELAFVDPDLAAPKDARGVLQQAVEAPSLAGHLAAVDQVNPIFHALRDDLTKYRAEWSRLPQVPVPDGPTLATGATGERVRLLRVRLGLGAVADPTAPYDEALARAVRHFQTAHGLPPSGEADGATLAALNAGAAYYERLIAANLQRARSLPPLAARRFILVNVAAGQLWLYENGKAKGSMRVIVGTRAEQTPMMVGLIRYLVLNPYWDVPVDLVRNSLAPKVLQFGPSYLQSTNMEVLADWSDDAPEVDPRDVDWPAVAAGRVELRVRQRPGGDNMMGQIKFMLPNELGIYLHDTPEKAAFQAPLRLLSAGCVRVERAGDLATWLLGRPSADATWLAPDQRVDLDEATPVYITYLTAAPGASGVSFYPDVYNRDPALMAKLS